MAAHAEDCGGKGTLQTIIGRINYQASDADLVGTPFTLETSGEPVALYPDGTFFGSLKDGDEGYEKNALEKLTPFVNQEVGVTGCAGVSDNGTDFHWIDKIMYVGNV